MLDGQINILENIIDMKQTICNAVYEAVKKYKPELTTSWSNVGFLHFEDMLHQIKTNVQVALWVLMELEHFSDWENDFIFLFLFINVSIFCRRWQVCVFVPVS